MNKTELVAQIAHQADLSKAKAEVVLSAFLDNITQELASGGAVNLTDFGSFQIKERSARTGCNPQTGKPVEIAAATLPSFKPGKGLKDAVNC